MAELYLGLISGTSMDGIEKALVDDFSTPQPKLIKAGSQSLLTQPCSEDPDCVA